MPYTFGLGGGVGMQARTWSLHHFSRVFTLLGLQRQSDLTPICATSFDGMAQSLFTAALSVFLFALCLSIGNTTFWDANLIKLSRRSPISPSVFSWLLVSLGLNFASVRTFFASHKAWILSHSMCMLGLKLAKLATLSSVQLLYYSMSRMLIVLLWPFCYKKKYQKRFLCLLYYCVACTCTIKMFYVKGNSNEICEQIIFVPLERELTSVFFVQSFECVATPNFLFGFQLPHLRSSLIFLLSPNLGNRPLFLVGTIHKAVCLHLDYGKVPKPKDQRISCVMAYIS